MLQAHDLLDILNFFVLHDLIVPSLANVQKLSAKWEHAKVITADDTKTSYGERFRRVTFCEDERAFFGMSCASVVCVRQLGEAQQPIKVRSTSVQRNIN
jgi:hypothetical protein